MSDLRTELEQWLETARGSYADAETVIRDVEAIIESPFRAHPDGLTPEDIEALRPVVDKQRRERIATAAMQGLLASGCYWNSEHHKTEVAQTAAGMADAILAELDKEES